MLLTEAGQSGAPKLESGDPAPLGGQDEDRRDCSQIAGRHRVDTSIDVARPMLKEDIAALGIYSFDQHE
jgi:hypothetical protein